MATHSVSKPKVSSNMGFQKRNHFLQPGVASLTIILLLLTLIVACRSFSLGLGDGVYPVIIENQTSEVLSIYYRNENDVPIIDIEPGKVATFSLFQSDYLIIAKTGRGEIVYSKELTSKQLKRPDKSPLRIIIPALEKKTQNSDNVTQSSDNVTGK